MITPFVREFILAFKTFPCKSLHKIYHVFNEPTGNASNGITKPETPDLRVERDIHLVSFWVKAIGNSKQLAKSLFLKAHIPLFLRGHIFINLRSDRCEIARILYALFAFPER